MDYGSGTDYPRIHLSPILNFHSDGSRRTLQSQYGVAIAILDVTKDAISYGTYLFNMSYGTYPEHMADMRFPRTRNTTTHGRPYDGTDDDRETPTTLMETGRQVRGR